MSSIIRIDVLMQARYISISLLISFLVWISFVPQLPIEEKDAKVYVRVRFLIQHQAARRQEWPDAIQTD